MQRPTAHLAFAPDPVEQKCERTFDRLVVTVEKADALLRCLGPLLCAGLALLILDEAHQVVPEANEATAVSFSDHNNRSVRRENLVSRILAQCHDVIRIALTTVASGASGPVTRWIEGRPDAEAVGARHAPPPPRARQFASGAFLLTVP